MSISLSEIIWTVICFGLFALVLNLLLIKPVLKNMDARREKVEKARALAAERENAALEAQRKRLEAAELSRRQRQEEGARRAAEEEARGAEELSALAESLAQREAAFGPELDALAVKTDERLAESMDSMISAFTEKLTKRV